MRRLFSWLGCVIVLVVPSIAGRAQDTQKGASSTPMAQASGEPEGTAFVFPPMKVDPRIYRMNDPFLSKLASKIEDGSANLIERRAFWWLDQRLAPYDMPIPPDWRLKAQRAIKAMDAARARREGDRPEATLTWAPIGPASYQNGTDKNSGRATAVWVDPANKNNIYLGTADGGVWKTIDQGTTWTAVFETAATLSIGSIAVDPNNKQVIYVGTGEGNHNADQIGGMGIYKSSDGGTTWVNKNAGLPTLQFYGFAQHPTDATKVQGGLQDNGQAYYNGTTWAQTISGDGGCSAWDQTSASYAYEEYVYGAISRNSNMTGTPTAWKTASRTTAGALRRAASAAACAYATPMAGRSSLRLSPSTRTIKMSSSRGATGFGKTTRRGPEAHGRRSRAT